MRKTLILAALLTFCFATGTAEAALKVIVLPLDNLSKTTSLGWMSEGLAISISEQLRNIDVDVIDQEQRAPLIESLDLPPNAALSRASMIRVAQEAGVDRLIMGSISGTADKLLVSFRILDMKRMRLGGKIGAEGPLATLPQMENELAWNLLAGMGLAPIVSREEFRKRARVVPNPAYALYVRALGGSDEDEQARLLAGALESYSDIPEAQYLLGRYYFQKGECAKAAPHLKLALRRQKNLAHAQFMLGTCYLMENNLDESIQSYQHLLALTPAFEAYNNLAVAYLRKGDHALAVQNLLEAHKLEPANLTIDLNLTILRQMQGNAAAAREVADEAVRAHPDNGMIRYLQSTVLTALGEREKAAAAAAQAGALGVDVEKLKAQDPKSWARIFAAWEPRP